MIARLRSTGQAREDDLSAYLNMAEAAEIDQRELQ